VVTCKKCGRQNEDHYKFCLGCGSGLEDRKPAAESAEAKCPQCGGVVASGQRFCGTCGAKVAAPAAPAAAAASAPPPKAAAKVEAKAAEKAGKAAEKATDKAVAHLTMVRPDGTSGEVVALHAGDNIIGRESDAEVFRRDVYLTPKHAKFTVKGDSVEVTDLKTVNGVFYRISEITELKHGDQVRIGQEVLRFEELAKATPVLPAASDGTPTLGSPAAGAWGRLERVSAPDQATFTFMLRSTEHVLGRERGDILFREDGYVSGRHARVFTDGSRFFIEDLKSSNGTFVRIHGSRTLGNNSLILLGAQPFRITVGS
jgi:pSer/pThr/pTyr-binding forkhead associated (FHA) protein